MCKGDKAGTAAYSNAEYVNFQPNRTIYLQYFKGTVSK